MTTMPLTRSFKETVRARAQRDAEFRAEMLKEALDAMIDGDLQVGKPLLRDYINATIGFAALAEGVGRPEKSLMRMFGPNGNPRAENLFAVIEYLQRTTGVRLDVQAEAT